jgi:hypothetical protein
MEVKFTQENTLETLSGELVDIKPTPSIHLKTIDDVRLEMAKVYRDMKSQKIPTHDGTRLVYVLAQIGKMIELHDIEKRIDLLEVKNESRK